MTRAAHTDPLESLAAELQTVSPGFAARLRDAAARLRPAAPASLLLNPRTERESDSASETISQPKFCEGFCCQN